MGYSRPKPRVPDAGADPEAEDQSSGKTAWRKARRVVVFVVGGTLLLGGIALLVLPGPAFIVIPAALAILAIEFQWARKLLRRARALLPQRQDKAGATSPPA